MITTRWINNDDRKLEDIIELFAKNPKDDINENSSSIFYCNWNIEKIFTKNQSITLNDKKIDYNYFKYRYDSISPGDQPIEDRTVRNEGIIIPYYNEKSVNFIINRNSDAKKIIRKIMDYTGKNEIEKNMFKIDNDFYIWLINKVYTNENVIEPLNRNLHSLSLDAIKGFKGNTEDLLTKVSANGESVMNIISTLSFFLESRNLNQITLELAYFGHESITLDLRNNGTISIYEEKYLGIFEDNPCKSLLFPKLALLTYLEIIPILIQAYNIDKENDIWNKRENINFLKKVAEELSEKVEKKVKVLEDDE